MKKFLMISIILVTIICGQSNAVEVPEDARVKNIGNYCAWSTLDTMARTNKIDKLVNLLEDRRKKNNYAYSDLGYDETIEAELKERKVKYELKKQFSYDRSLLEKYAETHGVAVALVDGNPWCGGIYTKQVRYTNGTIGLQYLTRWVLGSDNKYYVDYWRYGCHMIMITKYDDKHVSFYDSSRPLDSEGKPKIWTCGREWFDKYWLGNSVVVLNDD